MAITNLGRAEGREVSTVFRQARHSSRRLGRILRLQPTAVHALDAAATGSSSLKGDRMKVLRLALKGEYFDAIKAGTKTEEYRLCTPYWDKRLRDLVYDLIALTRGYPARSDLEAHLTMPWRGGCQKTITHPHFGPDPVLVYAITVECVPLSKSNP